MYSELLRKKLNSHQYFVKMILPLFDCVFMSLGNRDPPSTLVPYRYQHSCLRHSCRKYRYATRVNDKSLHYILLLLLLLLLLLYYTRSFGKHCQYTNKIKSIRKPIKTLVNLRNINAVSFNYTVTMITQLSELVHHSVFWDQPDAPLYGILDVFRAPRVSVFRSIVIARNKNLSQRIRSD